MKFIGTWRVKCQREPMHPLSSSHPAQAVAHERRRKENMNVTLKIIVPEENRDELIDAINETLNELARNDVINDDYDNAWSWE